MTENEGLTTILQKFDRQAQLIADQGSRLSGIEKAISTIAVQEERIASFSG